MQIRNILIQIIPGFIVNIFSIVSIVEITIKDYLQTYSLFIADSCFLTQAAVTLLETNKQIQAKPSMVQWQFA